MSGERAVRILRPSLALAVLALMLIVVGGVLTGPARAASSSVPSPVPTTSFDTSKAGETVVRAGEDVVVPAGTTTQTVVAAGGDVTVDGAVNGAVVALGGDVVINGAVKASVVAFGGDITVDGTVGASVVSFGGDVRLMPNAVVGTTMTAPDKTVVVFGGALTRDPAAQVTGSTAVYDNANWPGAAGWFGQRAASGTFFRPFWGFSLLGWIVETAICLVLALVAAALMPNQLRAVQRKLAAKPAGSLGWGALTFFLIIPAVLIVLIVSVVGLLLVLPYIVVVPLFYFFVTTAVGALVAGRLLAGTSQKDNLMLAVTLGVIGTTILSRVPVAGGLVLLVMAVFGAGAAAMALADWRRARKLAARPPSAPAPAGPPAWPVAGQPEVAAAVAGTAAGVAVPPTVAGPALEAGATVQTEAVAGGETGVAAVADVGVAGPEAGAEPAPAQPGEDTAAAAVVAGEEAPAPAAAVDAEEAPPAAEAPAAEAAPVAEAPPAAGAPEADQPPASADEAATQAADAPAPGEQGPAGG